jgi:hypothetical protein
MGVKEVGREVVQWIHLAQNRNKGQGFVNKVMNLQVLYSAGNFDNGKGLCSMEVVTPPRPHEPSWGGPGA